jgi:hypothetical protein
MITLLIINVANRLVRVGREARDTWRETQRLRRSLGGPEE